MTSQLVAQGLSLVPHGAQLFDEQRDDEQGAASCLQKDREVAIKICMIMQITCRTLIQAVITQA